ncbi:MAG: biotin transporter BioY [Lachnospiraceae bacterium]|nr:biotin transporter BioY [Lachnospiraceae bacterium]
MNKMTTYQLAVAALFTALMCIFGPIALPIGPVPISLTNLIIYIAVFLVGTKLGTLSYVVYLILGAIGLPVFSGYAGGLGKLSGPTGGYLIGFIPMAIISGIAVKKFMKKKYMIAILMVVATLLDYALGTMWFVFMMKCEVWYALTVCVFPFLLGDAAKIAVAIILGSLLRGRLMKLGFIKE